MKYKQIIILSIIFTCLLAISTVSATDNVTDNISIEETTDDVVSVDENTQIIKSVNNESYYSNVNSEGTFSDLANLINNGSGYYNVTLEKDYKFDSNIDLELKEGITIESYKYDLIIIDGKGHTIDGNGKAKIFSIGGSAVILKNIIFTNIYSSSSKTNGAIFSGTWHRESIIDNCSFININVKYGDSALTWHGTGLSLNNCYFANNNANNGRLVIFYGKNINVTNCTFINNTCSNIIDFTLFADCSQLNNCNFINNNPSEGSVVNFEGNECIMTNCSFVNNAASKSSTVYWSGAQGLIYNCSYVDNSAYQGGAIYIASAECILKDSIFYDNYALNGGAIYWSASEGTLTNCIFDNNTASSTNEGGAIQWNGKLGNISDCLFINNSAYGGSAISLYGDNSIVDNCSFIDNYGFGAAGAVYCDAFGCIINKSYFKNNSASLLAGAIFITNNAILENCSFINNFANDGGAIIIKGDNNLLENCIFFDNNASRYGGAIYLINNNCILENCSFNSNSADYGSGIFIQGENIVLNDNIFIDNSASTWGGAIYWMGTEGILTNSSFTNNFATNGGAIFWRGDNGTLSNCSFLDNRAYENGSSTYWYGNNGNLTNSIVIDTNNLNQIYWWNKLNGNIENCKFINNTNSVINNGAKFSRNDIKLSYSNESFDFKDPKNISVTLMDVSDDLPINSSILFNFNNDNIVEEFIVDLSDNYVSLCNELSDLDAGTWNITAIFMGDDNYAPCNTTFTITINPIICSIAIKVNDTEVDKETKLIVNIIDKYNSIINDGSVVFFDGEINIGESNVTDSVATLTYAPTTAGEHIIVAKYYANNYITNTNSTDLNVDKIDSNIIISKIVFDYGSIGSVSFSFDGAIGVIASIVDKSNAIVSVNGSNIFVSNLDVGNYSLVVTTVPDVNHNAVTESVPVTVNKIDSSVSVENIEFDYGSNGTSTVVLTGANSIIASVNDVDAIVNVEGNLITVSNLTAGFYTLSVTTIPDERHIPITKQSNIIVNPISPNLTVNVSNIEVGNNAIVNIEINNKITGKVIIDNNDVMINDSRGSYIIYSPNAGNHTISVIFEGDNNFVADTKIVSFEVSKKTVPNNQNPFIPVKTEDEKQLNNPSYTITLNEDATGYLTVKIGDKSFTKELVKGTATVEVSGVPAGDYIATLMYSGDDNYAPIIRTVNTTVKIDPVITASNVKLTYAAGSYYTIKVYGTDGMLANEAKVVITVNDKTFKTLTTTNGVAKFKVTNVPGTYKMNITALGKSVVKTLTVKHLVTLKSATVKKSQLRATVSM